MQSIPRFSAFALAALIFCGGAYADAPAVVQPKTPQLGWWTQNQALRSTSTEACQVGIAEKGAPYAYASTGTGTSWVTCWASLTYDPSARIDITYVQRVSSCNGTIWSYGILDCGTEKVCLEPGATLSGDTCISPPCPSGSAYSTAVGACVCAL